MKVIQYKGETLALIYFIKFQDPFFQLLTYSTVLADMVMEWNGLLKMQLVIFKTIKDLY